jgi:hypothetical protein
LYPDSEEERISCLTDAASEPDLFRDLQERFPDMIPPEDGIVSYLHRKGFNQSAIRPAAKAYLETMLFLEEERDSESHGDLERDPQESALSDDGMAMKTGIAKSTSPIVGAPRQFHGGEVLIEPPAAPKPPKPVLNKIGMNVQGHLVHIEALLDYDGLLALEKKIEGLKSVIDRIEKDELDDASAESE